MPERLVDVERQGRGVLHTFPVTLSHPADEETFKQKALEAAGHAARSCPKAMAAPSSRISTPRRSA